MDFNQINLGDDWMKKLRDKLAIAVYGNKEEKETIYEDIGYCYQCYAPASLYKYYSDSSQNLENVMNNKMWYSTPSEFNDVFDCDIMIDAKKLEESVLEMCPGMRGIRVGSPIWKSFKADIKKGIKTTQDMFMQMRSEMGIACFSELDDSLLMWAHYANNHRGMCVEYELLEINRQLLFTPVPVIYSEERVCFDYFNTSTVERDATRMFVNSVTTKSSEWSYEKEWRIIRDNGACGDCWNIEEKGALLDMIRPTSVTLGCMAKQEFEKSVYSYCKENKINLFKMQKDSKLFKLVKIPLLQFDD